MKEVTIDIAKMGNPGVGSCLDRRNSFLKILWFSENSRRLLEGVPEIRCRLRYANIYHRDRIIPQKDLPQN